MAADGDRGFVLAMAKKALNVAVGELPLFCNILKATEFGEVCEFIPVKL